MPRLVNSETAELGASLMCADQGDLRRTVLELDRAGIDSFHVDVMDGSFVPNFALSADAVRALRPATGRPFDVHLMVLRPELHAARFAAAGADSITFHAEAASDARGLAESLRAAGCRAGVAINPGTPVSALEPVIRHVDLVCVMTVEPGFAGQEFIEPVAPKLGELAALILASGSAARIQVDGNVAPGRIPGLLDRGASLLVGGTSAIFRPGAVAADEARAVLAMIRALMNPGTR
jgi:ribulose-phosphate 3-epimerase